MKVRSFLSVGRGLGRTGLLRPVSLVAYARMAVLARRWGTSPATGSAIAALRAPNQIAVADEHGCLSWRELDRVANGVARAIEPLGIGPGSVVAVMCRNHRLFVEAVLAASKLGADVVLLNTEFAGHQLGEVLEREGVVAAIFDDEFSPTFDEAGFDGIRVGETMLGNADPCSDPPDPPERPSRIVIMTSGTTGTPKGARRDSTGAPLDVIAGAFSLLPVRAREPVVVAPPLFHGLGFGFFGFSLLLHSTLVLRRKFDPEEVLADVDRHRATTLVAVPVMLRRIVDLPEATRNRYDTTSLRMIVCSGSALGGELATKVMDAFGDVLYNFYGSTETGWVAMAGPGDMRAAPNTVGRPPEGTRLAILDEDGHPVPPGSTGRIFVGSEMTFQGYTGGGGKDVVDGLMRTGDVGHLDESGRLFVEGRDDDMIVSGGENVFPQEVVELLQAHEAVADVAVVGVDDSEMGQRLVAFVVAKPGASVSADDIKRYVRSRLARYKVPRDVELVGEIPRTPTGKVRRGELQDS